MAKNFPSKAPPAKAPAPAPVAARPTTVSRNSPLPKPQTGAAPRTITHEMIAKRAYEIYVSGKGGSQNENWLCAERELRGV